jgi:hypothetical protein
MNDLDMWDRVEDELHAQGEKLGAFREYCQCFFIDALATIMQEKGWQEPEYKRPPTLGLRLECDFDMTLAVRPAWRLPKKVGLQRVGFGTIRTDITEVELLDPGLRLSLKLLEGQEPSITCVTCDLDAQRWALDALRNKTHDLLMTAPRGRCGAVVESMNG